LSRTRGPSSIRNSADEVRAKTDSTWFYNAAKTESLFVSWTTDSGWVIGTRGDSGIFRGAYVQVGDTSNDFGFWLRYNGGTAQWSDDTGNTWNDMGTGTGTVDDSLISWLELYLNYLDTTGVWFDTTIVGSDTSIVIKKAPNADSLGSESSMSTSIRYSHPATHYSSAIQGFAGYRLPDVRDQWRDLANDRQAPVATGKC